MKEFNIFDATEISIHKLIDTIKAANGKAAFQTFLRNHCMSVNVYEIRKIKPNTWEMSSNYGSYFYCCEKI